MPSEELLFRDGLGDRMLIRDPQGRPVQESLLLRPELTAIPSFEFALNERLWLVERFDHPAFLTVRNIVSVPGPASVDFSDFGLRRWHQAVRGSCARRVDEAAAQRRRRGLRDQGDPGRSRGASSAQRRSCRMGRSGRNGSSWPTARCGSPTTCSGPALEQLRYSTERYWKDLRVAIPPSAGAVRLDRRVDVAQVGMIAVALFASRELRQSESISGIGDVLAATIMAPSIRTWLTKALHMDPRSVFATASDAARGLAEAMSEARLVPAPGDLNLESAPSRVEAREDCLRRPPV